jgi:Rrf2 family iron-sulfur cluster assembly transcriptional regulator
MKLTTKGRYAVTAMLDLALNDVDEPVSLADISARQAISLSYLEQLFSKLRKAGLVVSMRGPGGGYRLKNAAKDIQIAEIIAAVDENIDATRCGGLANCQSDKPCLTHNLWSDLSEQIRVFLSEISLEDMKKRAHELRQDKDRIDQSQVISLMR